MDKDTVLGILLLTGLIGLWGQFVWNVMRTGVWDAFGRYALEWNQLGYLAFMCATPLLFFSGFAAFSLYAPEASVLDVCLFSVLWYLILWHLSIRAAWRGFSDLLLAQTKATPEADKSDK